MHADTYLVTKTAVVLLDLSFHIYGAKLVAYYYIQKYEPFTKNEKMSLNEFFNT